MPCISSPLAGRPALLRLSCPMTTVQFGRQSSSCADLCSRDNALTRSYFGTKYVHKNIRRENEAPVMRGGVSRSDVEIWILELISHQNLEMQ